jgi:serine/threonine protein kinase
MGAFSEISEHGVSNFVSSHADPALVAPCAKADLDLRCKVVKKIVSEVVRKVLVGRPFSPLVEATSHENRTCYYTDLCRTAASKIVTGIFIKILSSSQDVIKEGKALEVRWMATGSAACWVQVSRSSRMADVKLQVQQQVKVPVEEKRLFSNGDELLLDDNLPQSAYLQLVRCSIDPRDPRITNLAHFHPPSELESLNRGSFRLTRKIREGINGDIFLYQWSCGQGQQSVAVKKLRNSALAQNRKAATNEWLIHTRSGCIGRSHNYEDALTEIGILSHLSKQPALPLYLLKAFGVYSEGQFTWLITEFADGGDLFDLIASRSLAETEVRDYTWQLLQAVDFLHRNLIGHRDISLENILLKGDTVKLMDFGMSVRSHSSSGTPFRYFAGVGKGNYRAPECYVPSRGEVSLVAPPFAEPGGVAMVKVYSSYLCEVRFPDDVVVGKSCTADVWGYAVVPADMFAVGTCMFMLAFQIPIWHSAHLSDPCFRYVYDHSGNGIESLLNRWRRQIISQEGMDVMLGMLQMDPSKRSAADRCIGHPWFVEMADRPVQLHGETQ